MVRMTPCVDALGRITQTEMMLLAWLLQAKSLVEISSRGFSVRWSRSLTYVSAELFPVEIPYDA
jgi:hypothetical protein